ncbi:MAG: hypothetical protein ACLUNW_13780, partial [Prevotella sp.]
RAINLRSFPINYTLFVTSGCKYTKKRPHGKGNGAFSSSATLCEASSAGSCVHSLAAKRQGYHQLFVNNKESISVYQNDARKQAP